jgi:hypothetical protein
MTKIWSAVAERSADTAFGATIPSESGVALRFPPHSIISGSAISCTWSIRGSREF